MFQGLRFNCYSAIRQKDCHLLREMSSSERNGNYIERQIKGNIFSITVGEKSRNTVDEEEQITELT